MNIIQKPSPNFDSRNGVKIDRVILHWIVGDLSAADAVFANPAKRVSAHYAVGETEIHQYVKESDNAWHSGVSGMNRRSIGIEHRGGPELPITELTYKLSAQLLKDISVRLDIPLDREHILKHSEVKATQCPGTLDLDKLINLAKTINDDGCANELIEMRASRDKWKLEAKESADKHAKEIAEKNKDYERLQSTLQESNLQVLALQRDKQIQLDELIELEDTKIKLENDVKVMNEEISDLTQLNADLRIQNTDLNIKINKKLKDFSLWEILSSRW